MRIRFVAQPFEDQSSLREFLGEVCTDPTLTKVVCVVAWAKRSGLTVLAGDLRAFRVRADEAVLLVGISQGGASRQGLAISLDLFDHVFVVHDEGVTFHPKVYLAEGEHRGRLFVGSPNLSLGGIQANYEAALDVDLDLDQPEDRRLRDEVRAYVDRLLADTGITKPLDDAFLAQLVANPRYRIQDEDARPTEQEPDEAIDSAGDARPTGPELFGRSTHRKRRYPPTEGPTRPRSGRPARPPTSPVEPTPAPVAAARVVRHRWFKTLPAADAQHPTRPDTNMTGSLRLTQARHPIDQTTYFRQTFFGGLAWAPDLRRRRTGGEAVEVTFQTALPGRSVQTFRLLVAHDPSREAGQGNFSTSLHWGDLIPDLLSTDYTGHVVTLERHSDDTFRLTVARASTGPFVH